MSKAIFITNGHLAFNQSIAARLLGNGYRVALHTAGLEPEMTFVNELDAEAVQRLFVLGGDPGDETGYFTMLDEAITAMKGLDVMIHGNEMLDEAQLFEERPDELGSLIPAVFERIFLWNKAAVSYMIKRKSGKILFPIVYDTLYYDGYPSSPILNHGKISMMKCLSRECSVFRLDVNTVTFGYHDAGFEKGEKKEMQRKLEIFGLKPALKPMSEMLSILDFMVEAPGSLIGGQNIEVGVGIETNL